METKSETNSHLHILKRVGKVLLIVGLLDIGLMIYCVVNGISYSSSFNIFAVIAGIFLLRGSLRAASIVRWFAAFMLAALLCLPLVLSLLQPLGLTMAQLRLYPWTFAIIAAPAVAVLALLIWVVRELGQEPVLAARGSRGGKVRSIRVAYAAGVGFAAILTAGLMFLLGGETANRAREIVAAQLGASYNYRVSSLSWNTSENGQTKSVSGVVTAWNDEEILQVPVQWDESGGQVRSAGAKPVARPQAASETPSGAAAKGAPARSPADAAPAVVPATAILATGEAARQASAAEPDRAALAALDEGKAALQRGDHAAAIKVFRPLAERGDPTAAYALSVLYADGRGVAKDDAEALAWLRKSADKGFAAAQHNLGNHYLSGRGVAKDDAEAAKWFRKAADQGFAVAQTNLGVLYQEGRGLAQDNVEAVNWFRKAADQGLASGQNNLAVRYVRGEGVAQDYKQAAYWYEKAAMQGHRSAQSYLAYMYSQGQGVGQDYVEAYKWWTFAGADPSAGEDARRRRASLEQKMTPQQIAEGQERVRVLATKSATDKAAAKPELPAVAVDQRRQVAVQTVSERAAAAKPERVARAASRSPVPDVDKRKCLEFTDRIAVTKCVESYR